MEDQQPSPEPSSQRPPGDGPPVTRAGFAGDGDAEDRSFRLLREINSIGSARAADELRTLLTPSPYDVGDSDGGIEWYLDDPKVRLSDLKEVRAFIQSRHDAVVDQIELERMVQLPDREGWVTGSNATGMIPLYEKQLAAMKTWITKLDEGIQKKVDEATS